MSPDTQPRVTDNDQGEITVSLDGHELRGWSYKDDSERRTKMIAAREYVEGWCDANAKVTPLVNKFERAFGPFDDETPRLGDDPNPRRRQELARPYPGIPINADVEWFVVEQPPGNKDWETQVTDQLSRAGYHVARFVFDAEDIGAPYPRRRVYLIACTSLSRLTDPASRPMLTGLIRQTMTELSNLLPEGR